MKQLLQRIALVTAICGSALAMHGQATNSGDIRGTAQDDSGALIPDVTVTVTNLNTGVVKKLTTNKDGLYDTSSIVVGTYSVKFEKSGFQTFERSGITLEVGTSTINGKMHVGSVAQEVVVTTDIPLLTTETGEQSTTFEARSMAELPNVGGGTGPDWQNFTILLPGSAGAPGSNGGTNPGQEAAINGNLPYSNVLADGVSTTLSHSQNSDVNTFETIAELQVNTSAFSAQYGIGGVIFNQITKGGTNQFHGSLYEYFQTDKLNAYPSRFLVTSALAKGRLRYNDFGGAIGGPVLIPKLFNGRDKAFFFFNYDQIVNHGGAGGNAVNDVPTAAVMGGDFTGQPTLYDPTTQTIAHDSAGNAYPVRQTFLQEYGSNEIPQALIDKASGEFQKLYPTPNNHIPNGAFQTGVVNGRGVLQKNFVGNTPATSTPYKRYFGRFDYNITSKNRLTLTDQQRDTPVLYPSNFTICPVECQFGDVDSNTAQVTDVHTFTSHTINEFRFGYTYQGNFYVDESLGSGQSLVPDWGFAKANTFPTVRFTGNYPYAWIAPSSNAVYKEHVFDPSDVVTLIHGKHILHFGGEYLIYQDNSTNWGNENAGTLDFNGYYTRRWTVDPKSGVASPDGSTGQDYADFLLGYADAWSASVSPEYGARLKSPQVFVQDDYKIRPNLTVNIGLRYQIRQGWSETHGNEATFDPTVLDPKLGKPGAFWYGTTQANGRSQTQQNLYKTFLPRAGFSWLPRPEMTIRGGFGIYAYNLSLDTYGGGIGGLLDSSGSTSDTQNGVYPLVKFASNGTEFPLGGGAQTPLPYTSASTDPSRFDSGQQNVSSNPYRTPDPKIYQYNLAVQNAIGTNMVFELAYVGSHATNLFNGAADLNAVPLNLLSSNDQAARPYPTYGSIGTNSNDGISNYNSLQASIKRRLAQGLSFEFNYTWAHFLDTYDSSGWGSRAGVQTYQYVNNAGLNYSNSNFDIRNAFKGRVVYQLPFGHGRMFMNHNRFLDAVLGGYQVSSTMILQSGNPFSVLAAGTSTYQQAGSQFANLVKLNPYAASKNDITWIDPTAFTAPGYGAFGNTRRNQFYGPGNEVVNLSLGKTFSLLEGMKFELRADATNAFNHVNPGDPGGGTISLTGATAAGAAFPTAGNSQNISGTAAGNGPRTLQLAGRFTF